MIAMPGEGWLAWYGQPALARSCSRSGDFGAPSRGAPGRSHSEPLPVSVFVFETVVGPFVLVLELVLRAGLMALINAERRCAMMCSY